MGKIFEGIVREAYQRYSAKWGLPAIKTWGSWEGMDRDRQSIELDITSRTDDGRLLAGEVKWSNNPRGADSTHERIGQVEPSRSVRTRMGTKRRQCAFHLRISRRFYARDGRTSASRFPCPLLDAGRPLLGRLSQSCRAVRVPIRITTRVPEANAICRRSVRTFSLKHREPVFCDRHHGQ